MPTLNITSPALPARERRAIAIRFARWFADRGVSPSHVVVTFTEQAPASTFAGGFPAEGMAGRDAGLSHAGVVCCLGPDRDDAFRAELAHEMCQALGADDGTGLVHIEFRTTDPGSVHLWRTGRLERADAG